MMPTRGNAQKVAHYINAWRNIKLLLIDATCLLEEYLMAPGRPNGYEDLQKVADRVSANIREDALDEAHANLWRIASNHTDLSAQFWFRMADVGVRLVELAKE